ncbi:MAG: GHMP kinase [Chloroflexi bacterium]|nr:GHMP kinase [Chloroflexota bacterium]
MIITQAPLRISLLGGGSDFPAFFAAEEGCVLSSAIDKYISVVLKRRFDARIRVGYTRTELVDDVAMLEHDLVREAMRITGIRAGVELATLADIPSRGSGLGSSSTVSVALLHAMWSHLGVLPSRRRLAEAACALEIERLGRPIGVQDQYASAYGGLNLICFSGDAVRVEPVSDDERLARRLGERLLLFFTGVTRASASVLNEQQANIEARRPLLRRMAAQAREACAALRAGELDALGELMHEGWQLKRQLASGVSNPELDALYARARAAGAAGGKIAGAGGGGFLLLYCTPERQADLRAELSALSELEFALEREGATVLLHQRRG